VCVVQHKIKSPEDQRMVNGNLPFVIGAGMGRTGSLSLYTALNQLGYKSFHMKEIMQGSVDINSWADVAEARVNQDTGHDQIYSLTKLKEADKLAIRVAKEMIDMGYNATTDFPISLLYKELMDLVPDAKVILSVRTNGDVWSDSVMNTIGQVGGIVSSAPFRFIPHFRQFSKIDNWIWNEIGVTVDSSRRPHKDELVKAYNDWNESVIKSVPKDRLLIHQSRDGFAPICKHLGIPENECPQYYPHVNDSTDFEKRLMFGRSVCVLFWILVIGVISFILRKMTKRTHKNKSA